MPFLSPREMAVFSPVCGTLARLSLTILAGETRKRHLCHSPEWLPDNFALGWNSVRVPARPGLRHAREGVFQVAGKPGGIEKRRSQRARTQTGP